MKNMNKTIPCLLLLGLLASTPANSSAQTKTQTPHTLNAKITKTVEIRYQLHLPEGYDSKAGKKWPTILFLHGAGERGDDIEKVTVHGPPMIVKNKSEFPFIVISPQCPAGERWQPEQLIALLDRVSREHAVDRRRVYLTGLSMGGYGSWELGVRHHDRFAAIAPICGGGTTIEIRLARRVKDHPLKSLPVWAFHGAKDSVVPLIESERMVDAFKAIGNESARLTVYPEANHNSWTETYDNPKLYEWFLSHSK